MLLLPPRRDRLARARQLAIDGTMDSQDMIELPVGGFRAKTRIHAGNRNQLPRAAIGPPPRGRRDRASCRFQAPPGPPSAVLGRLLPEGAKVGYPLAWAYSRFACALMR